MVKEKTISLVKKSAACIGNLLVVLISVNITVRRSRQSGVARATCPD